MGQVLLKTPSRWWAILCALVLSMSAFAQNIVVKGNVVDETGEPVIGATVRVSGANGGAVTDLDGNFTLEAKQGQTITVSYIGYKEATVQAAPSVTVRLEPTAESLDEVVVIGYGQVKKSDMTGSVTALGADKLVTGPVTSATDMLVGQAAGVSVITDGGAPGAGATIRIRGGSSMSASNNPLIVIDGVPVDDSGISGMANPLASVHPNDIETFTILKDASATAIYGSRASNGVIIITTKKGSKDRIRVSYAGNVKVSTKSNDIDVMGADDFRNFVKSKFGEESLQYAALGQANTNWQNEIFRTAVSTDHNISVNGSLPYVPYRVSFGFTDENGIVKTSNMQRYTGAINLSPQLFDKHLSINLNVKGIYTKSRFADTGAIGMATQYDPTQPVYMDNSEFGNGYFMYLNEANGRPIDIGLANPVAMLQERSDKSNVLRSIGNIQIDYKMHFLPELRANLNLGYDISKGTGDVIINDNSPMSWCQGSYKTGFGENTSYYQLKRNQLLEFYLDYSNTFGDHFLDVMAGYSYQHFYLSEWTKYPYSTAKATETGNEFYKESIDNKTENYLISFFGRINYTFKDRYLLTFTLRDDGSSRFNKANRWGLFPSVALAWRLQQESFLRDVNWLSDLKLRLGYGVTGQQNLNNGDYPYLARYSYSKPGANYYFGNTEYQLIAPQAYDENLKWEQTSTYNIALDFGFLNSRLTGTFDLYWRKTENLLNTVTAPAGTNFSNELLTNVGTLENRGFELTLTARPVVSRDWNWTINYNISYNRNRITKLTFNDDPSYKGVIHGGIDGATGYNIQINAVDQPYNSFYVFQQMYDTNGQPIEGAYVDQNGDNKIDEEDLIAYKKSAPDVYMGLSTQLRYKNWDLLMGLRASFGNYVYNNVQSNREAWDGSQMYDQTGFLKNRLTSAWSHDFRAGQYRSSYYIQKADFFRMDNITIGYTFDKLFNDKQSARIYFTVQNPFVATKYSGLDPEISGEGIDNNLYPRPRSYMLGLSLNF